MTICGQCKQIFIEDWDIPVRLAATGEPLCDRCYRPYTLRLSRSDVFVLRSLQDALAWTITRLLPEDLECTCDPEYEYDTNAHIHSDDCSSYILDHIEATLAQIDQIFQELPNDQPNILTGRE